VYGARPEHGCRRPTRYAPGERLIGATVRVMLAAASGASSLVTVTWVKLKRSSGATGSLRAMPSTIERGRVEIKLSSAALTVTCSPPAVSSSGGSDSSRRTRHPASCWRLPRSGPIAGTARKSPGSAWRRRWAPPATPAPNAPVDLR